jgi:hypothetical protein
MSRYEFLLFVHIATAAIWVGGATIMQFFGLRAMRAPDPMRLVTSEATSSGSGAACSFPPPPSPLCRASCW